MRIVVPLHLFIEMLLASHFLWTARNLLARGDVAFASKRLFDSQTLTEQIACFLMTYETAVIAHVKTLNSGQFFFRSLHSCVR